MEPRNYQSGASATPPAAPVSPSNGYPTNGDPMAPTPATQPGAFWFHQISEELRGILGAAGIAPSSSDLTQLLTALRSSGVFQTQAKLDRSSKAATTEFVQLALGNLSGFISFSASSSLTTGILGNLIQIGAATPVGQIFTLPSLGIVPSGYGYWITNSSSFAQQIKASGTELIIPDGFNSIYLQPGESCFIVSNYGGNWDALIQKNQGNLHGIASYSASAALNVSNLGSLIQIAQATTGSQVFTLPSLSVVPSGYGYWIVNLSGFAQQIKAAGTETILPVSANSFLLQPGESCFIGSNTGGNWNVFGAIVAITTAYYIGTDGYKADKINGLIEQWGTFTTSPSGFSSLTFPVAFPNEIFEITASVNSATGIAYSVSFNITGGTLAAVPVAVLTSANAFSSQQIRWSAKGK